MGFNLGVIAFFITMVTSSQVFATCSNTPGYYDGGLGVCWATQPSTPTQEFSPAQYPVCGSGRIALSGDGTYTASTFSSSGLPNSTGTYTYTNTNVTDTQPFAYVSSAYPNPPIYGYPPGWRCYCMSTGTPSSYPSTSPPAAVPTFFSNSVTGGLRQYPVTYDVINSQTQSASVLYAPVPIDKNVATDGRIYNEVSGGTAVCSCPNINEIIQSNGSDGANWVGNHCTPMVNAIPYPVGTTQSVRVLTTYNPLIQTASKILSSAVDTTTPIASVLLPNSGADQVGTVSYQRKIWTCADPYGFDGGNPANCVFTQKAHQCDDGSSSGQASAVSDLISPVPSPPPATAANKQAQFNNTVNRKLACCLNAFHLDGLDTYEKFDCIDNSQQGYANFDALWSSADDPADGGQMNAILFSDGMNITTGTPSPKIVSGFYGLDGHHCDQFSEFAYPAGGTITGYRVDPKLLSGQQNSVGGAGSVATGITHPVPATANYALISGQVTGTWNKTIPVSVQDMLSCPILVRAAIVASCPPATIAPNALTTYSDTTSSPPKTRCAVAGGVQIHLRIEQIFEISGTAPVVPFDSMAQLNSTTSIDVSKLILDKVGDQCPPGTTKRGDLCSY